MAGGWLVAEALLRGSQALRELSWKRGSLFCLAMKQTKAQAFSSSTEAVSLSSSPLSQASFTTRKVFRVLCQKDQVYFVFNISRFPKLPPHWLLAVRRRKYRKLSALVQGLVQSPAVLCTFHPADWNDARDCQAREEVLFALFPLYCIDFSDTICLWLTNLQQQPRGNFFLFSLRCRLTQWSMPFATRLGNPLETRLVDDKTQPVYLVVDERRYSGGLNGSSVNN